MLVLRYTYAVDRFAKLTGRQAPVDWRRGITRGQAMSTRTCKRTIASAPSDCPDLSTYVGVKTAVRRVDLHCHMILVILVALLF